MTGFLRRLPSPIRDGSYLRKWLILGVAIG